MRRQQINQKVKGGDWFRVSKINFLTHQLKGPAVKKNPLAKNSLPAKMYFGYDSNLIIKNTTLKQLFADNNLQFFSIEF